MDEYRGTWGSIGQWCSGKFSLVGTLTWHYGQSLTPTHIPYRYEGGGGGGT